MAEEKSIIFKSEAGAFDRAGINEKTAQNTDVADKAKSAEKAIKEASDFYKKEYVKALKEIDPAYTHEAFQYKYAHNSRDSDLKYIRRTIDEGEAIDSAKDLIPRAKKTAQGYVSNAQVIKNGSVTKIIEKVGIKNIKEMDGAEVVIEQFNEKLKGTKISFDSLLDKFSSILEFYDSSNTDTKQLQTLYSHENNAIISALAKIIQRDGGKNEAIDKSAGKFDEYLKVLSENKGNPLEGAKEKAATETQKEESKLKTETQKIESVKEETTKSEVKKETPTEVKTETKSSVENQIDKATAETGKKEESKSIAIEKKSTIKKSKESTVVEDIIKDLFGDRFTSEKTPKTDGKVESTIESILGVTSDAKSDITGLGKKVEKAKSTPLESTKTSILSTDKSTLEKKSTGVETKKESGSIKETVPQKLSSVTPTPVVSKEIAGENISKTSESMSSENKEEITSSENKAPTETKSEEKKEEMGKDTQASEEGDGLSKKMDLMISLLSQLNDTLQGPLLVTNSSKKFE